MHFCELVISIIYSQLVTKLSFVPLPAGSDFTTKKTAEHLLRWYGEIPSQSGYQ